MENVLMQYARGTGMNKNLEVFRQELCFNKKQIQNFFEQFIEHHRTSKKEEYSEQYRQCLLELCDRFKIALDRCKLPMLKEDWWFYDYEQINDGIELYLSLCEDFELDEEGDISTMTASERFILLSVKCDYLTVEQYAQVHRVIPTTVRQWIRRGKLRTAKKTGRDWLIPSIADKPTRGFESVTYIWDSPPVSIESDFPFLKGYNCIYIHQDKTEKAKFHCIMGYPGAENREKITLSIQEREKLELALIANPTIKVELLHIMFKPSKYRIECEAK